MLNAVLPAAAPLLCATLNHLLRQESWARDRLRPYAGQSAHFALPAAALTLAVDADGFVAPAADGAVPAVRIDVPAAAIGAFATGGQAAALKHVRIDGDAEFANTISQLAAQLRWDATEDLAALIGDPAAQWLATRASSLHRTLAQASQQLVAGVVEYLVDERPTLVAGAAQQQFAGAVAKLRDDVARLDKRIARLQGVR